MEMDVQEWVGIGVTRSLYKHGLFRFVFRDSNGALKLACSFDGETLISSTMSIREIYYIPKGI